MSDSEFYMWRALLAFAVVDRVLTLEKRRILKRFLKNTVFTDRQKTVLARDMKAPKDVEWLFVRITDPEYREKFCTLARELVGHQGADMPQAEQLLKHLSRLADKNGGQGRGPQGAD
ncbi:MAG: hypothetical protein ACQEQL_02770 [Pseudomonadota bacterium]